MQSGIGDKYITKDGIVKKRPIRKSLLRTDPKLDGEFGRFASFLRKITEGLPDKKVELYFDEYINRLKNIKELALKQNTEYKGDVYGNTEI